ncbi:MAG: glycosyltransferase family 2 protein [Pseudomonadota bacterium]
MPKLSIVVPAYNEASHIDVVVHSLLAARDKIARASRLDSVEIIVVNDGSTDGTGAILDRISREQDGTFRVVTHEENSGYGAALKSGFRASSGEYLSFMDADGTISPESFISMYDALKIQNADMVVGTRFGRTSEMPFLRRLGNRFFALLLRFLSGQPVRDTASGVRLFRREIVPLLLPLPDGLHFTPAMSTKAVHEHLKVIEVPVPYAERSGDSKLKIFRDGFRFLNIMMSIVLMYNPFKVFFFLGLLCELVAVSLFSIPIFALLTDENVRFLDYIYRSIGGLYFFTVGVQFTLFGILARFMVSTFFKSHESGKLIHKLNRILRVYDWMSFYGFGVVGVGVVINALYFWKYVFGGGLSLHWAWLLLAAGFIIVGFEMVITGVIMKILKDIKTAKGID